MDEFNIKPKKGRETNRAPTEKGRHLMSEAGKYPRTTETRIRMSEGRRQRFLRQNPLKDDEIYVTWIAPDGGRRHTVALDSQRIEYSRDGVEWKIAKRINYHKT